MTEIPYIDKIYWEDINTFLSQLAAPNTGGIHFWNSSNPKPSNLGLGDEGRTGWEDSSKTLQRWTGSSWLVLTYGTEVLRPFINTFLTNNGNSLNPQWLRDLIVNSFINWNTTTLPTWIVNIFNTYIDNLPLSAILPLLNTWTPSTSSPLNLLITQAALNGGMTPDQFITLFASWPHTVPAWIVNYINALVANKSWSNTSGEASYNQLLPALTEWFNTRLKNDIASKISLGSISGVFTFAQIQAALGFWFTSSLKAYIDSGDAVNTQYMINIFSSVENTQNSNRADIIAKLAAHSHSSSVTPITNFTGYAAWPNTQANAINTYNFPVIIGACVIDTLSKVNISVFPYDHSQSVWGNYSARVKIVILPSSVWPDKSGPNNSPNGVNVSSLLAATSNIITVNCPDTSQQFGTQTSFSHMSSDNMYFVYLIWERVYWPNNYIDKPMTGIVGLFKSDGTKLESTVTSGPSTVANMRYSTFYGYYNGPGETTP